MSRIIVEMLKAGSYQISTPFGKFLLDKRNYWDNSFPGWTWVLTVVGGEGDGTWTVFDTKSEALEDLRTNWNVEGA